MCSGYNGVLTHRPLHTSMNVVLNQLQCVLFLAVSWRGRNVGAGRSLQVCGGHGRKKAVTAKCEIKS